MEQKELEIINYLRSPRAIRERCQQIFLWGCEDQLAHFQCDLSQLEPVADYVIQVIKNNYPDLNIPIHSRWRHFEVGHVPRLNQLNQNLLRLNTIERAKIKFDLIIISVLLDAGAGAYWQYNEIETGQVYRRSEGLAVATLRMFCHGTFSSNSNQLMQVDSGGLFKLTEAQLAQGFQVNQLNHLVGLGGRLQLLHQLGKALESYPELFGTENQRPGNLVNYFLGQAKGGKLPASAILETILSSLAEIWPGRF